MSKFLLGPSNDTFQALHDAGVFADDPKNVRRVVIDLEAGSAAVVYVQLFLDDSFVDVVLAGGIKLAEGEA